MRPRSACEERKTGERSAIGESGFPNKTHASRPRIEESLWAPSELHQLNFDTTDFSLKALSSSHKNASNFPPNFDNTISSPYHVGLHASPTYRSRISEGPSYLIHKPEGLLSTLQSLSPNIQIHTVEIPPVENDFEGEIGRSFEILRRTSVAVADARSKGSFPVVVAGNCCASVGVMAGLCSDASVSEKENEIGTI